MVSITLLAAIMIGLLAMFNQAQKALHIAHMQSDVFENARGAMQIVGRDLAEMTGYSDANVVSAYAVNVPNPTPPLPLPGPPAVSLPLYFDEAFWLTRVNDDWQGIGYYIDGTNFGVGTLYRFSETTNHAWAAGLNNRFHNPAVATHRISDGIVHFSMQAVYVTNTGTALNPVVSFDRANSFTFPHLVTEITTNIPPTTNNISIPLPAFVDLEIGVLETATLKQFNALTNSANLTSAQNFLRDHVGRIHFFRERVPIRNFINPYRANEVP